MKKYLIILISIIIFSSCESNNRRIYPRYTLDKINYIPDSLKVKHRNYIISIISAASNNMSGGDYEDVDVTIIQAERTASKLFGTNILGLRKEFDDDYYNDVMLLPSEMTPKEKLILDSLLNE